MLTFIKYITEGKNTIWTDYINKRFGKPTDSEIDHIRYDLFHTATNEYGENLRDKSEKSQNEVISSLGKDFNKHKHLRPLSGHERDYMQHIYFNHYRPAINDMVHAKETNNPVSYNNARQRALASRVEIKHHFGQIWSTATHMSSYDERTPKQQEMVDALHDLGLSRISRQAREVKRSREQ